VLDLDFRHVCSDFAHIEKPAFEECRGGFTMLPSKVTALHSAAVVSHAGEGTEPVRLLYSYYTAGTGGVGPTILETSFLLAGEPVLAYKDGKQYSLAPVSERRCVDFGPGIGKTGCFLYNLPEVKAGFEVPC
jgi:hypothetical protein